MVAWKMVSRHPGDWTTFPPRNFIVLVVAWLITAALLGVGESSVRSLLVLARRRLRSLLGERLPGLAGGGAHD